MWVYMNGKKFKSEKGSPTTEFRRSGNIFEGFQLINAPIGTHQISCLAVPLPNSLAPKDLPTDFDGPQCHFEVVSLESDPRPTWQGYRVSTGPWPTFEDVEINGIMWNCGSWGSVYHTVYLDEDLEVSEAKAARDEDESVSLPGYDAEPGYKVEYLNQTWVLPYITTNKETSLPVTLPLREALAQAEMLAHRHMGRLAKRFLDAEALKVPDGPVTSRFDFIG